MRIFLAVQLLASFIFAAQIEVSAQNFSADEKRLVSEFSGNVVVVKEQDILQADRVVINFDARRQPVKYTAFGNVSVKILLNGKHYNASGSELIYEPDLDKYTLLGGAYLSEIDTDKKIYGEKIEMSQKNGTYSVEGKSEEPAKFIFQIEENDK